jgi:oxygen-dependent protoporphyrinogen oxidase
VNTKVVVIGGGLAGLTAAHRIGARADVIVLEAGARLGGQIETERRDGFLIERGGEGFVARSTAVPALVADLGMPGDSVIAQATLRSFGYDGSHLVALGPGEAATFLGFQVPPEDLGKGIRTLREGMGSLVGALAARVQGRADVRTAARALSIERKAGGVRVTLEHGAPIDAAAAVVATGATAASLLLAGAAPEPARALAAAITQSSVTVELAYPRAAVQHSLDGSGFVVTPSAQREGLRACTFSSSKFAARAPAGFVALRAFFRPTRDDLALSDAAWIARAVRGVGHVVGIAGDPRATWVSRWPDALPVFDDAHRARVAALEAALEPSRIALAGSAFHGSGIDAAVRSGERAAARVAG